MARYRCLKPVWHGAFPVRKLWRYRRVLPYVPGIFTLFSGCFWCYWWFRTVHPKCSFFFSEAPSETCSGIEIKWNKCIMNVIILSVFVLLKVRIFYCHCVLLITTVRPNLKQLEVEFIHEDFRFGLEHVFSVGLSTSMVSGSIPSGKLTQLWKITIFNGKNHYFYGHVQ